MNTTEELPTTTTEREEVNNNNNNTVTDAESRATKKTTTTKNKASPVLSYSELTNLYVITLNLTVKNVFRLHLYKFS